MSRREPTEPETILCRKCGQPLDPDEVAFGSAQSGWEHPFTCPPLGPESREIKTVDIAGRTIDAHKVVCPECNALDLNTDFETSEEPWVATCTKGHVFGVTP